MTIDPACPEVGGGPPGAGEFGPVRGFSTQNPQPLTESSKVKAPQRIRQALSAASLAGSGRRLQRGGCSGILKFARGEAWGIRHTSWSLDGSRRNRDACSAHVFSGGRIRLRSGSRLRRSRERFLPRVHRHCARRRSSCSTTRSISCSGAGLPVQISNCRAPCCTNISTPLMTAAPREWASFSKGVSIGL